MIGHTRSGFAFLIIAALTACGGRDPDPEAVARIVSQLEAHGAGPGAGADDGFSLAHRMAHHAVPGVSIAVVDSGRIVWARGFGVRQAESTGPSDSIRASTLFQAASISKPVAASAMLRMVEAGLLDLDRPIDDYVRSWTLPEGRQSAERPVTLRRIASHSAGFTVSGFPGYARGEPVPTVTQILEGEEPANTAPVRVGLEPGEEFRYSGGGFTVMQVVMQDVSERPFPELMREWVLEPIAMNRSTYDQPLPDGLSVNAAAGHDSDGKMIRGRWRTYPEMAAAGLWTTPTDLMTWAMAVADSTAGFLSPELARQMLRPQIQRMGIGVIVRGAKRSLSFSHWGSNVGYRGAFVFYPETNQGAAVLTNGNGGDRVAREVLAALAEVYRWPDDVEN